MRTRVGSTARTWSEKNEAFHIDIGATVEMDTAGKLAVPGMRIASGRRTLAHA
ncbi:hypothetical protein ACV22Y_06065 [Burkholderia sp. AW50-3]